MDNQLPSREFLQLRVPATPQHVNAAGDIFGGWIMSQVDIAGSIPAVREARGRVATVAVKEFIFLNPVSVGDLVNIYASIESIGNTSITVNADVFVERKLDEQIVLKVAQSQLVYVALDEQGKPRTVKQKK